MCLKPLTASGEATNITDRSWQSCSRLRDKVVRQKQWIQKLFDQDEARRPS